MSTIHFKGNPVHTEGNLPALHHTAPAFTLTNTDLNDVTMADFAGHRLVLNIFPSLDTAVCAMSVRRFNELANQMENTKVLCVSADLPFAQKRFCGAEHLEHVVPVSQFRHADFGKHYGVTIADGPLAGLLARAVIIIDEKGKVTYTQLVAEITEEPNYDAVVEALQPA